MARTTWPAIIILAASALPGTLCAQTRRTSAAPQTAQPRIEKLQEQIEDLRREIASLRKSLGSLNGRIFRVEINQNANQMVSFDLTSRSFQRLDTSTGSFLVSILEASPYLDGYRVVLSIGNPSFATYTGFRLTIKWNRNYDWEKYSEGSYEAWNKDLREKEVTFPDSLKPGAWNRVEVLLPSTKGDELGYFVLSMATDTVSLYKER